MYKFPFVLFNKVFENKYWLVQGGPKKRDIRACRERIKKKIFFFGESSNSIFFHLAQYTEKLFFVIPSFRVEIKALNDNLQFCNRKDLIEKLNKTRREMWGGGIIIHSLVR